MHAVRLQRRRGKVNSISMNLSAATRRYLGFCCLLATCWLPAAACPAAEINGEDISQGGFGRSAPVLAALEKFHHDQGHYPLQEQELVPRYLPGNETFGTYRRVQDGSFALTFGYTRGALSGLTVWTYYSRMHRWVHSGFY